MKKGLKEIRQLKLDAQMGITDKEETWENVKREAEEYLTDQLNESIESKKGSYSLLIGSLAGIQLVNLCASRSLAYLTIETLRDWSEGFMCNIQGST